MKSFLILLFTIAFAAAIWTPSFTQCGDSSEPFLADHIVFHLENTTLVGACGKVTSKGLATAFHHLDVEGHADLFGFEARIYYPHVVANGLPFCLNYTADGAWIGVRNIYVNMSAKNILGKELGCVNVTLKYSEPKFLDI